MFRFGGQRSPRRRSLTKWYRIDHFGGAANVAPLLFLVRDFRARPASVRQRGNAGRSHVLRFLPFLAQQLLQYFDAFVHMFFLQQERRQEAQDRVLGRVEEHTLDQSLLYQWTRGNVEHQALNEPAAARFAGRGVLRDEFLELLMQVAANSRDVFEQVLFFYDCQIFEPDAAGQRTTAEGSAVLSGRNRGGEVFFRQERAERHP